MIGRACRCGHGALHARVKYEPNVRMIRVMCSGRVDPTFVLKALAMGADGVMILGCHIGDCHYGSGNHRTAKRMPLYRNLLEFAGIEPERFFTQWVSASEGGVFAEVVKEFTETLRGLPPMKERLKSIG